MNCRLRAFYLSRSVFRAALLVVVVKMSAIAQPTPSYSDAERRRMVALALAKFPWRANLADSLGKPGARLLGVVRDVASEQSGAIERSEEFKRFTTLHNIDLPRDARNADGQRVVLLAQRATEDFPRGDTLYVVVGVSKSTRFGEGTRLVTMQIYCGYCSSLGAVLVWLHARGGRVEVLDTVAEFHE